MTSKGATCSAVCLLLAGMLTSGCGWTRAPGIGVIGSQITDESGEGAVLSYELEASNQNDKELPIGRVSYTVWIDGERVFGGTRNTQVGIRRRGSQRFSIPVPIRAEHVPGGEAEVRISGRATYTEFEQIAKVLRDIGLRNPGVRFGDTRVLSFGTGAPSNDGERAPVTP